MSESLYQELELIRIRVSQARKMYEQERESIEAQYWEARDQIRQRLLGAIEDRRKRLREEKEGGEIITGDCYLAYKVWFSAHFICRIST